MATTIAISEEMKAKLRNLGRTGDSYEDVIRRMYEVTKKHMLMVYLYDTSDSIPIADAIKESKERWRK